MKPRTSRMAMSALFGLFMLGGGTALAQGEYDGSPAEYLAKHPWVHRNGPVWGAPVVPSPGWHHPGWYGPGVGIYVAPPVPRYRPRYHTRRVSDPHVEWCYSQYRSYREWDNSWQPLRGPRRECISPFY